MKDSALGQDRLAGTNWNIPPPPPQIKINIQNSSL